MPRLTLRYVSKNLSIAIGLVLIWRGIWYVLDWVDMAVFDGNHVFLALGGIVLGIVILYAPDRDLDELKKL